ncbi:hypothetical protein ACTHGN_000944 [Pseudomonas putida]
MKITDLDLEEMIVQIAGAVSPFVFGDLGPGTSAKTYTERASLQGEVMGRILAVLMVDQVCGDTVANNVESCIHHMQQQTLKQLRSKMVRAAQPA